MNETNGNQLSTDCVNANSVNMFKNKINRCFRRAGCRHRDDKLLVSQ